MAARRPQRVNLSRGFLREFFASSIVLGNFDDPVWGSRVARQTRTNAKTILRSLDQITPLDRKDPERREAAILRTWEQLCFAESVRRAEWNYEKREGDASDKTTKLESRLNPEQRVLEQLTKLERKPIAGTELLKKEANRIKRAGVKNFSGVYNPLLSAIGYGASLAGFSPSIKDLSVDDVKKSAEHVLEANKLAKSRAAAPAKKIRALPSDASPEMIAEARRFITNSNEAVLQIEGDPGRPSLGPYQEIVQSVMKICSALVENDYSKFGISRRYSKDTDTQELTGPFFRLIKAALEPAVKQHRDQISDERIAQMIKYVRKELGNNS